eukprot:GILJ01009055.1.p1 GENE.GILJ01009055.1~~GILJ01009055.1.p1  ORF type:complete len:363 (+),score=28.28 GILJ01009055.1:37-1125(+)
MAERCNKCGIAGKLLRCAACQTTFYCTKDHQKEDWPFHKSACALLRKSNKNASTSPSAPVPIEEPQTNTGECVGTFRWAKGQQMKSLPAFPSSPPELADWKTFVNWRFSTSESDEINLEPAMLDALSYPLSLVFALKKLNYTADLAQIVNIAILGATAKAEERIALESDYFTEIINYFPSLRFHLHFVGPEISRSNHLRTISTNDSRCTLSFYRGTAGEFFLEFPPSRSHTVLVSFNPGYGSGFVELTTSWIKDLVFILRLGVPMIFTCANDYSDLRGEQLVLKEVLGPRFILEPMENPFRAVSYFHEPGKRETAWSCSNSYVYAIQCFDGARSGPLLEPRGARFKETITTLCAVLRGFDSS